MRLPESEELPDLSALAARYAEAAQRAKALNQAEAFLDLVTASRTCFALKRVPLVLMH
jgi:hypothetical protein